MLKCVQPAQRSSAANGPWRRLLIASPEFPTEKEEGRKEGGREGGREKLVITAGRCQICARGRCRRLRSE